jgi:hypothetical protein
MPGNPKPLKSTPDADDRVYGAAAIASITGLSSGEVYYHFKLGRFGSAVWKFSPRKLAGSRRLLREGRFTLADKPSDAA